MRWSILILILALAVCVGCASQGEKGKYKGEDRPKPAKTEGGKP